MNCEELLGDRILAPLGMTMTGITAHAHTLRPEMTRRLARPATGRAALVPRWDIGVCAASGRWFRRHRHV
jgi:CubicO group peptidase (beta-lactamase class C family)